MLAPGQSGATFHPAGILAYVKDMTRGTNAEIGLKASFWNDFRLLLGIRYEVHYFNIVVL